MKPETKPKTLPAILIFIGSAFLLGAIIFALDNVTAAEPAGLGKWIFDIFIAILGAGTGIKGWLDLQKKDKPAEPASKIIAFDQGQVATGESGRNIQTQTYIERAEIAPSVLETHDTIGYIPPAKAVTYIHRGSIEKDVMEFLKDGGTGAIVGLHAPGGLGKTELAKHVSDEMKDHFDGVLWVDVGEKTPPQVVADMLIRCGITTQPGVGYETQKNELHHFLGERCLLVILDDVRQPALSGLKDILPPKPCATLLTSRIQQIGGVNRTFALDRLTE